MTQYRRRVLFAGLAIFLIALLINFPADRALYLLREKLPAGTGWQQVSGPVLHPVFQNLVISLSTGRSLLIESAGVRISILPLLLGRLKLQFDLRPDGGEVAGVAILNYHGWQIPQIKGQLPIQALSTFLPELQMAGPNGHIVFTGNTLASEYRSLLFTGDLEVNVEELQLDLLSAGHRLGNYSLQLQARQGAGVHGSLKTVSTDAQLNVQGEFSLDPADNMLRFEGQGWVAENAPDSIRSLLPLLGSVTGDRAHIQWKASL